MTIANPKYAFLELDYNNPNLATEVLMIDESIERLFMKEESEKDIHVSKNKKLTPLLFRMMWNFKYLWWIPVDIFCITLIMVSESFI